MRYYIIAGFCILIAFGILAFSCEKPIKQVKAPSDIGVIWNYSNASTPPTLDLYNTNPNKKYNPLPKSVPPKYLQEPCNSWNTLPDTPQQKQWLIQRYTPGRGLNPCSGCHCNTELGSYYTYWVVDLNQYGTIEKLIYCVNVSGQVVNSRNWWANPDNQVIRWRP